ncbi:glycosyltransferase family 90 protein [Emericellopsis atlantica]|uniref:Glycosyltransferase family 90 protein n=1 Tax=Emericellopsis atlantica TaxID=2614577 RepID=A0A9P7ZFA1_9HYPO|nr:glycosyltransferase family 90 protein [Emericellopsis atlantica]KAG9251074.1 glycosyltransferase family 90 protein [Emericellopsis atlantica]
MPKILSPSFPPRRPSGIIRYTLVGAVLIMLYYFYVNSPEPQPEILPPANAVQRPAPKPEPRPLAPEVPITEPKLQPKPKTKPKIEANPEEPKPVPTQKATDDKRPDAHAGASDSNEETKTTPKGGAPMSSGPEDVHPLDRLIYDAEHTFAELLSKETRTLSEAAQAYRERRGRHPPPGFDRWFEFAQANDALIIEDFFDQVHQDIEPLWGLDPAVIRKESWDWEMTINIRDGVATAGSDWFLTQIWLNMISTIAHLLPDMDLPLNAMDEPRLVVPWEDMEQYMKKASKTVRLPKAKHMRSDSQKLPPPGYGDLTTKTRPRAWEGTRPYWKIARRGCPPDSSARQMPLQDSFDEPPDISMSLADPHMFDGYVYNFTLSKDICHQGDLQGLEGIFIDPLSVASTKVLTPFFGGSKLGVNNEILLPAPMYWAAEEQFTGGEDHGPPWDEKSTKAIWRDVATGGRNRENNWRGFQVHRFIAMTNATTVTDAEHQYRRAENWALPEDQYDLPAKKAGVLGDWVGEWSDTAFTDLNCEPKENDGACSYTSPFFNRLPGMSMAEEFASKYLPDIDGNSFSGRYLGLLRSTSLPVKATVWREWHDSRLVAWKHFVPMDNRFGDFYGIMNYFIGFQGRGGHDAAAEKIASAGKEWAERVLRKEDMQVYTLRVLLEYARLLDDRRQYMGWVDDVLADPTLEKTWSWWW